MSVRRTATAALLLSSLSVLPIAIQAAESLNERIDLTGDYRYAVRESESPADAKALACREAWRQAIATSALYREHSRLGIAAPSNNLAARYAAQVVEETEQRKTVSCKVRRNRFGKGHGLRNQNPVGRRGARRDGGIEPCSA